MLKKLAVGTFSNYEKTETALTELKENGFLMNQVSVVGRDINKETELAGVNTSDQFVNADNLDINENQVVEVTGVNRSDQLVDISNLHTDENKSAQKATDGAMAGITIGGFTGLLVGLGALAIPGIGPVMLAGAAATALASAISGGVIGGVAGSLAGGLVGLGIPADRATVYNDLVSQGNYLVMVEGSEEDITVAESIFSKHHIHEWYVYDLSTTPVQTVTTTSTPLLRV